MTSNALNARRPLIPRPIHCKPPPPPPPPPPPLEPEGVYWLGHVLGDPPSQWDPWELAQYNCRADNPPWDPPTAIWTLEPDASIAGGPSNECPEDYNLWTYTPHHHWLFQAVSVQLIYADGATVTLSAAIRYEEEPE